MDWPVRRVITGQTHEGKSVFTHVEDVEPLRLGGDVLRYIAWGWEETPTLPYHHPGSYQAGGALPRRPGAVQIETWVLPPRFPLEGGHVDASRMHATDTVDVILVLEGEIYLEQSDGVEVRLQQGDILVQNGALHTWHNRTDRRCVLAQIFFGTTREEGPESAAMSDG